MTFKSDLYGLINYSLNDSSADYNEVIDCIEEAAILLIASGYEKISDINKKLNESLAYRKKIIETLNNTSISHKKPVCEIADAIVTENFANGTSEIIDKVRHEFSDELFLRQHPIWNELPEV